MKNPHYEQLGRRMRDYHKTHALSLSKGGLLVQHGFEHMGPDSLSWRDDVGFALNGRMILVSWQHPRAAFEHAISDVTYVLAGPQPPTERLKFRAAKNYKLVGKSGRRKKLFSYTNFPPTDAQLQYEIRFREIERRLTGEGIDIEIPASWSWRRLPLGMNVTLTSPLEVRSMHDLGSVASMVRRLIASKSTINLEFPGYSYRKADWIRDQMVLNAQRR